MNPLAFEFQCSKRIRDCTHQENMEVSSRDSIVLWWHTRNQRCGRGKALQYRIFLYSIFGQQRIRSFSNGRSQKMQEKYDEIIQKCEKIHEKSEDLMWKVKGCEARELNAWFYNHWIYIHWEKRKYPEQAQPDKQSMEVPCLLWNGYILFILVPRRDWKSVL